MEGQTSGQVRFGRRVWRGVWMHGLTQEGVNVGETRGRDCATAGVRAEAAVVVLKECGRSELLERVTVVSGGGDWW